MSIGFGLIGAGLWGEMHALIFSSTEGVNFEAVCDIDEERAREIAKKYGVKKWYTRYQDIVDDPDVKALTIATPDFAHKEPAIYAAKMGKHILIEKPLATTVEDAVAINEEVEKAGIIFMVDFHNRWNPAFINAKDSINKGEIGEPSLIYIRHSNTTFIPFKMLVHVSLQSFCILTISFCDLFLTRAFRNLCTISSNSAILLSFSLISCFNAFKSSNAFLQSGVSLCKLSLIFCMTVCPFLNSSILL